MEAEKACIEEETAESAVRKKIAIFGLFLQIGVTVAYLLFFFIFASNSLSNDEPENLSAFEEFIAELPELLLMVFLVGVPSIVIGIISLLFRRKSGSGVGMVLIIIVDVAISIFFAVLMRNESSGFIGSLIICLIVFSISAIPGFLMASKEVKRSSSSSSGYSSGGYSSSGSWSSTSSYTFGNAWANSRDNGPYTCGNCLEYSNTYGKCKRFDRPKSAEDKCSNWR